MKFSLQLNFTCLLVQPTKFHGKPLVFHYIQYIMQASKFHEASIKSRKTAAQVGCNQYINFSIKKSDKTSRNWISTSSSCESSWCSGTSWFSSLAAGSVVWTLLPFSGSNSLQAFFFCPGLFWRIKRRHCQIHTCYFVREVFTYCSTAKRITQGNNNKYRLFQKLDP